MGRLRDQVRAALDGMATRQAMRNAARASGKLDRKVRRLRREGWLDPLCVARETLASMGVKWTERTAYGVTLLTTQHGLQVAYSGPDKSICRKSDPAQSEDIARLHMNAEQYPMFNSESLTPR